MYEINENDTNTIFEVIQKLQEERPYRPLTTGDVFNYFNDNKKWYRRKIYRGFKRLVAEQKIITIVEREYWLPKKLASFIADTEVNLILSRNELYRTTRQMNSEINLPEFITYKIIEDNANTIQELKSDLFKMEQYYEDILEAYEQDEILKDLKERGLM